MSKPAKVDNDTNAYASDVREFVTVFIGGHMFGVEVSAIHDVFAPQAITPVPHAAPEVAGVLNLRGRIVTAIDARVRLGLERAEDGARGRMAIGIEKGGESYGLVIDKVGEVLKLGHADFEPNPANLDARWRSVTEGVYRLPERLLIILDIERMLDLTSEEAA
jgi:purine-binding chemotaxis protein CheW